MLDLRVGRIDNYEGWWKNLSPMAEPNNVGYHGAAD